MFGWMTREFSINIAKVRPIRQAGTMVRNGIEVNSTCRHDETSIQHGPPGPQFAYHGPYRYHLVLPGT